MKGASFLQGSHILNHTGTSMDRMNSTQQNLASMLGNLQIQQLNQPMNATKLLSSNHSPNMKTGSINQSSFQIDKSIGNLDMQMIKSKSHQEGNAQLDVRNKSPVSPSNAYGGGNHSNRGGF